MEPNFDAADYSLLCDKETCQGALVFHFQGGFSMVNHVVMDRIVEEIKAAPERKIVLNLTGIRFMDSMGIGVLVAILKHTRAKGIDFVLVTNDVVDQILGVTRLNQVLRAVRSQEEALR